MNSPKFETLDIRLLLARGKEPLSRIRARLDALEPGHGITVVAPFIPAPLIELLKSEGFRSTMEHAKDGSWAVKFWRE